MQLYNPWLFLLDRHVLNINNARKTIKHNYLYSTHCTSVT